MLDVSKQVHALSPSYRKKQEFVNYTIDKTRKIVDSSIRIPENLDSSRDWCAYYDEILQRKGTILSE